MTDTANRVTYLVIACTGRDRWFDLDAVRHEPTGVNYGRQDSWQSVNPGEEEAGTRRHRAGEIVNKHHPAGAPPLDWFTLPADELSLLLCKAMVPRRVCRVCGQPSRRIVELERLIDGIPRDEFIVSHNPQRRAGWDNLTSRDVRSVGTSTFGMNEAHVDHNRQTTRYETVGWTDCDCPDVGGYKWRPGVAYDPFPQKETETDMPATFIVGDALGELKKMPDASVDLVMTSPAFLALRSYLPADHPDKAKEMGSESTPGEYLDVLLDVIVECRRVLAPHGSLVVELGDTYSGNERGATEADWTAREGFSDNHTGRATGTMTKRDRSRGWPLDKSLTGIPQLFMLALTYGRNLLTGRELEPWRVRNFSPWCRPNPPVGALGDKFRPATSYLTVACTARDRWFDLDAVRTVHKPHGGPPGPITGRTARAVDGNGPHAGTDGAPGAVRANTEDNPAGAPPLDWFNIPTAPYKGAHYATYPSALVVPFVKACCPQRVCRVCGEPSRRIVDVDPRPSKGRNNAPRAPTPGETREWASRGDTTHTTIGWTDCGHDDWRPGLCLDPFAGSGTTLQVATGHGRDAIGIDLDPRNADLARERVGMFLTVEDHETVA